MADRYSVVFSPQARDDLHLIRRYIREKLLMPEAADRTVERILKACEDLDVFPERHRIVEWEPWASLQIHIRPVGNYNAYYSVNRETHTVCVLRVFHSGRDTESVIQKERG